MSPTLSTEMPRIPVVNAPIRVLLADSHPAIRRSLRMLLDVEDGFQVVAEADELDDLMRAVALHRPNAIVLDLSLPNGSSFKTIRELSRIAPGTRIVAISTHVDPAFARAALHAGAVAFVRKEHADSELPHAIRQALGLDDGV